MLQRCGIDDPAFQRQNDPAAWPDLKQRLAALIETRSRDAWCEILEGSDACVAPVLDWDEAPEHPHNRAREAFVEVDGVLQPAPAPRFSRTPADTPGASSASARDTHDVLAGWGVDPRQLAPLRG